MTFKKGVKYITVPKFIINKFELKECPYLELPDYVRKSGICLKNSQGVTLRVEDLAQLRDILTYFRAAAQVCLQLVYKHMVIEQNLFNEKGEGAVQKNSEEIEFPSYHSCSKKMRQRRKIDIQKRCSSSTATNEKPGRSEESFELRFGLSNDIIWDRRKLKESSNESIKNEFYRHLILRTRKQNTLVKKYSFFKDLFSGKIQCC